VQGEGKDLGLGLDTYSSLDLDKDYYENESRDLACSLGLILTLVFLPALVVLLGAILR
jgi:hypothetical protein